MASPSPFPWKYLHQNFTNLGQFLIDNFTKPSVSALIVVNGNQTTTVEPQQYPELKLDL
jgi:hypothetical protein